MRKLLKNGLILISFSTLLIGCSEAPAPVVQQTSPPPVIDQSAPPPKQSSSGYNGSNGLNLQTSPPLDLVTFEIKMAIEKLIKFPSDGVALIISITPEGVESEDIEGWTSDSRSVRSTFRFAHIKPNLPDAFELIGDSTKGCIELSVHDANDVDFRIKPNKTGKFALMASVDFYAEKECKGKKESKLAKPLEVTVEVDRGALAQPYLVTLWDEFWKQFLVFWGVLLTAIFAFLTFKVKKRLDTKES